MKWIFHHILPLYLSFSVFTAPFVWTNEIEVFSYSFEVLQKTPSFYLLHYDSEHTPEKGRLLLLKKEQQNVLGTRIIEVDALQKTLIVQLIKNYPHAPSLSLKEKGIGIEKKADLVSPPDTEAAKQEDQSDSAQTNDFPEESERKLSSDPSLESHSTEPLSSVSEEAIMVPYSQSLQLPSSILSASGGIMNQAQAFSTAGVRLGFFLKKGVFFYSPDLIDCIGGEGSLFFYKALGLAATGDSYTFLTPIGTLQYQLSFEEVWGISFYGGFYQPLLVSSSQADPTQAYHLTQRGLALGVGAFFRVGPHWFIRGDVGTDSFSAGLMLRL